MRKGIPKNKKIQLKQMCVFILCEIISIYLLVYSCIEYQHVDLDDCKEITGTVVELKKYRKKVLVNVSGNKAYLSHFDVFTGKRKAYKMLQEYAGKEMVTIYVIDSKNVFFIDQEYPEITEIRSGDQICISVDDYNSYNRVERSLGIIFFVLFQIVLIFLKFDVFDNLMIFLLLKKTKK